MADNKTAWMQKAQIDYFAPFLSLWLACNSWYCFHYSELTANGNPNRVATDRDFVNYIKSDFTGRNHLYTTFKKRIERDDRNFKTNLELLHKSLARVSIKPEKLEFECSFNSLLVNYSLKADKEIGYINIIKSPNINRNGEVSAADQSAVIKLDVIYISSDYEIVFAGIFELIYQIRNQLVHGNLNPDKNEHEVVKYCYMILLDLMAI